MSRIGVLGEAAAITKDVITTVYTVPSGRGAKVKIMFRGTSGTNSTLKVTVNNIDIFLTGALTLANISYSSTAAMHQAGALSTVNGATAATTVAPGPVEYQLAAGDSVTYLIGTADFSLMSIQVIGAEVEVS